MPLTTWLRFGITRLGSGLVAVFGVCVLTFVTVRVVANPVELLAGMNRTPETVAALTRSLGLDKPLWLQFAIFLEGLSRGDLGISTTTYLPVSTEIGIRLPATVELLLYSTLLATLIGVSVGAAAAFMPGSVVDRFSQLLVQLGSSLPSFWIGLLLTYLFFALWHIAPAPLGRLDPGMASPPGVTGLLTVDAILARDWPVLRSAASHLALPCVTLAIVVTPSILQITRTTLSQVLGSDYIRSARSLGIPRRKIYSAYALRGSLVPIVNVLAMTMGWAISGAVLVEVVFGWPGIGSYAVTAMSAADYAPVVGVVLVSSVAYVFLYVLTDIISALIDPRISLR
jgi:peptide/nickel transport system permease protein